MIERSLAMSKGYGAFRWGTAFRLFRLQIALPNHPSHIAQAGYLRLEAAQAPTSVKKSTEKKWLQMLPALDDGSKRLGISQAPNLISHVKPNWLRFLALFGWYGAEVHVNTLTLSLSLSPACWLFGIVDTCLDTNKHK